LPSHQSATEPDRSKTEKPMTDFLRRAACAFLALTLLIFASPVSAQQVAPGGTVVTPQTVGTTVESAKANVAVGLHDLSPWSMFLNADLVVKAIMVGLAFASLVTWTIFVGKFLELFIVKRRLQLALDATKDARSLREAQDELGSDKSVNRLFVAAALNELRLSAGIDNESSIKERAVSRFSEITRTESRRIRFGMGLLATIAATSPFVGLFGTVWGIMNSFIGISKSQTTNLAVVAPGIAEALLATAIGLVAAIPAVIIYNHFARVTKGYLDLVSKTSGTVGRQLSRDLDRMHMAPVRRAAE
jgi:biopolymer transport protein ExbB